MGKQDIAAIHLASVALVSREQLEEFRLRHQTRKLLAGARFDADWLRQISGAF